MLRHPIETWLKFRADQHGGIAVMFALALVPMIVMVAGAVDFGAMSMHKAKLQAAADAGALQSAKELRLAQMGQSSAVISMAKTYASATLAGVKDQLGGLTVDASLVNNNASIRVAVTATYEPKLLRLLRMENIKLSAQATATSVGYPLCALALDPQSAQTIYARTQAQITAQYCAVHSNSKDAQALYTQGNASMSAGSICSGGGFKGRFTPTPIKDCPVVEDPLAARPAPPVGACAYTDHVISGGTVTLMPGNYCGGLHVTAGAIVTLSPGVFVISNGPLKVDGGASLTANGAGIYLTGAGATLSFAEDTTISLTAPTNGPMAGLLVYEDRNAPTGQRHDIFSDNAPTMLCTIYLPRNQLYVETNRDVAKASAFTIVVAHSIYVTKGSNFWLNADYKATSVPVPSGLNAGHSYLTH